MVRLGRGYPIARIDRPRPAAGPAGPTFEAVGAGSAWGNSSTVSWTHPGSIGYVFVGFTMYAGFAPTIGLCNYGSQAMTQLGFQAYTGQSGVYLYGLSTPAAGSQTVTISTSGSAVVGGCNSISYKHVTSVAAAVTNSGSSTAPTQSLTVAAQKIGLCVMGGQTNFNATPTGGTSRYYLSADTINNCAAINDATTTTTFNGSLAVSAAWGTVGVVLS